MSGTIYFRGPVGSMEGPRLDSDPIGVGSCVLRVPWYGFCCLECKNIAYIVDLLWWSIWIKDSETPIWWGLKDINTDSHLMLKNEKVPLFTLLLTNRVKYKLAYLTLLWLFTYISNYQSCKDFEFDSQWSKDPTPTTIHQEKSIMDLPENQCLFREIEEMKLI